MAWRAMHIFYYDNQDDILKSAVRETLDKESVDDFLRLLAQHAVDARVDAALAGVVENECPHHEKGYQGHGDGKDDVARKSHCRSSLYP